VRPDAQEWFQRRTSLASDWPTAQLADAKGDTTVSVVLPALDEEHTVGEVVRCVYELAEATGLVDELVVMDSGSTDATAVVAAQAGATVVHRDDVLSHLGSRPGKGEVLWKSLDVTKGDLIVFCDSDLHEFGPHYITGLLGPLLADPGTALVKGFYERPLAGVSPAGGGRVTELVARPLLNLHFPALAGVIQPLSGEYAARRDLLEQVPFVSGYGVEIGLLIDTLRLAGVDAIAQVDLGRRVHGHQSDEALGRMSMQILQTVLSRLGYERALSTELTQFRRTEEGSFEGVTTDVPVSERPAMRSVVDYAARRAARPATPVEAVEAVRAARAS